LAVLAALLLGASQGAAQKPNSGMPHTGGGIMYHAPQWSPDGLWLLASANLDGDAESISSALTETRCAS
jgi:hypothetical protein